MWSVKSVKGKNPTFYFPTNETIPTKEHRLFEKEHRLFKKDGGVYKKWLGVFKKRRGVLKKRLDAFDAGNVGLQANPLKKATKYLVYKIN